LPVGTSFMVPEASKSLARRDGDKSSR